MSRCTRPNADSWATTIFDPARDGGSRHRLETLEELRVALRSDQLVMHYQPKLDLASGACSGVEALVRWEHPTRGLLFPDIFLPIAERAGLMATGPARCSSSRCGPPRWRATSTQLSVAVNLFGSNLQDAELPSRSDCCWLSTASRRGAVLEITENDLWPTRRGPGTCSDPLRGSGSGRDRRLRHRLLVAGLPEGAADRRAQARPGVRPAHEPRSPRRDDRPQHIDRDLQFGMRWSPRASRTRDALQMLREAGCDVAQGYHIARPMPAEQLTQWLDAPTSPYCEPIGHPTPGLQSRSSFCSDLVRPQLQPLVLPQPSQT